MMLFNGLAARVGGGGATSPKTSPPVWFDFAAGSNIHLN
jgi:hypothetical protein